jgi:hypothetical protein
MICLQYPGSCSTQRPKAGIFSGSFTVVQKNQIKEGLSKLGKEVKIKRKRNAAKHNIPYLKNVRKQIIDSGEYTSREFILMSFYDLVINTKKEVS